jgi:Ser/Thr protein kinase RdoA (MazF antagonist)
MKHVSAETDGAGSLGPVLQAFGVSPCEVREAGGTAAPKWILSSASGPQAVLRTRPAEFADPGLVEFDHAVLRELASRGFPAPDPQKSLQGGTFVVSGGRTYELLSYVDGDVFRPGDTADLRGMGAFLARLHQVPWQGLPAGKSGWPREDHPSGLCSLVGELLALARSDGARRDLLGLAGELSDIWTELDDGLYGSLPQALTHGDVHPGNFRFRRGAVSAVYDFDYVSVQARLRDISDAVILFASQRAAALDPDSVFSLAAAFRPSAQPVQSLFEGYYSVQPLEEREWSALPLVMRSRWIQIRLRNGRKVPAADRIGFVTGEFSATRNWLRDEGPAFFDEIKNAL